MQMILVNKLEQSATEFKTDSIREFGMVSDKGIVWAASSPP